MKIKSMLRPIVKPAAAALAGLIILTAPAQAFAATDYTAKVGDTFWELSRSFDVPLEKLMSFNKDVKPTNIYPGLTLSIPASAKSNNNVASNKNNSMKAASTKNIQMLTKEDGAKHIIAPSGTSYKIGRTLNIKASAYTSAASENGKWGAVDYFGNTLKVGTVAVDPKEIPLGTKLYITGYDYNGLPDGGMIATASDVGGAIKGERIDLFVPGTTSQAKVFGYQWVKVHVLK
ncbi:3D domain-containing protein [Paenibacillus herberti]|uniref:LysM domain-containing protein n=1 Tax=Paenibacillus herberti TaxID=1619309 RepID=A0A229NTE1_9BACL|nr:3D domain-containing protein [Paenibacillus herberti]OXM13106.1 hypothetical protein CGZ75_23325 [Paenibacillus herberti]